ncbi:hypothetical protein BDV93DRAFT_513393 [Ceratobasidium sp. AG-I]|nr:hypothetical protein BDV93DRAFT_513393 [Ceratobasidium sp. AG-I]
MTINNDAARGSGGIVHYQQDTRVRNSPNSRLTPKWGAQDLNGLFKKYLLEHEPPKHIQFPCVEGRGEEAHEREMQERAKRKRILLSEVVVRLKGRLFAGGGERRSGFFQVSMMDGGDRDVGAQTSTKATSGGASGLPMSMAQVERPILTERTRPGGGGLHENTQTRDPASRRWMWLAIRTKRAPPRDLERADPRRRPESVVLPP